MWKVKIQEKKYILGAVLVHFLVIAFVMLSFSSKTITLKSILSISNESKEKKIDPKQIVQAVAVSENELNAEIERIEKIEQQKKHAADSKLKAIQKKEHEAEVKRVKEEEKLVALKKELIKAKQDKVAEENGKKLLQANIDKEKAQLEKLRQEKESIQKNNEKVKKELLLQKQQQEREEAERKLAIEAAHKAAVTKELNKYVALIKHKVEKNWVQPQDNLGNLSSVMLIRTRESGEITEVRVVKSSGNPSFDRSAELAILKSSPLPMPYESEALASFRVFNFTFKPPGDLS